MINIIISTAKATNMLDRCIEGIVRHTKIDYMIHTIIEPSLNIAECRQLAMDTVSGRYMCFVDDDAIMIMDNWLTYMYEIMVTHPDAGAVFQKEWWGSEPLGVNMHFGNIVTGIGEVPYGPSACMLIDRTRIPDSLRWDASIGLRSGWLGGDFEEVDWQYKLHYLTKCKYYISLKTMFHHVDNKFLKSMFFKTDRFRTVKAMQGLLIHKYHRAPEDDDFFKGVRYIKARPDDDCMFIPGGSVRQCYRKVIQRNGLKDDPMLRSLGVL